MTKEEAKQIIATWLVSSKGAKGQRGYIEGWFDEEDAEAFRMAIEALSADVISREKYDKINDLYSMSIKAMMNKPIIIRCKDCRFNNYPLNDLCPIKKAGIYPDDDDFCSYGERQCNYFGERKKL